MGVRSEGLPYANKEWYKRQEDHAGHFRGRTELTELQLEFIDWLLDPSKDKGSQDKWASEHGTTYRTLKNWKKTKLFTDEWEKRAAEAYGGMERLQSILDRLYETATENGDVKAIQLYLQYVDRYTPKKKIITEGTSLEDLSDEDLAQLGENITRLRGRQANG